MREVVQITQCRTVRFASGERFPLVVDARGIPLIAAIRYLANRRNLALNTLENTARTLAKVHDFLESRDVNIAERVAAGSALTMDELTGLRDHLRTIGRRTETILTRSSLREPHNPRRRVVEHAEWYARCRRARAYLKWLIHTEMERANSTSFERVRFEVKKLESRLTDLRPPPDRWEQTSLSVEQRNALIETVTVGSPKNPFSPTQQLRNMVLIAAYYETGLRKHDKHTLAISDINRNAGLWGGDRITMCGQ
jgi:site-specific recombinase XerD